MFIVGDVVTKQYWNTVGTIIDIDEDNWSVKDRENLSDEEQTFVKVRYAKNTEWTNVKYLKTKV